MDENSDFIENQVVQFINSKDFPEALERLAKELPLDVLRSLLTKYLKVISSIMDKMLDVVGLEMENPDALDKNLKDATDRIRFITRVMMEVLKDPTVRQNIKDLALALNDSALRPFLTAALATVDEMMPAIDIATDKLSQKIRKGLRKLGDAAIGAAEDVIGTTPYIGNVWNATSGIANTLQGVQAIMDTISEVILETTFRMLLIIKKVKGPGLDAVDSFVDFGLNAYNTYQTVIAKIDSINAMAKGVKIDTKANMLSKENFIDNVKKAGEKSDKQDYEMPIKSDKKGEELKKTDEKKPDGKKIDKVNTKSNKKQKGGKKETRKRHRKKRTGRFRKTRKHRGGNQQLEADDVVEPTENLPAANKSNSLPVLNFGNIKENTKKIELSYNISDNIVDKINKTLKKLNYNKELSKDTIKKYINQGKEMPFLNKTNVECSDATKALSFIVPNINKNNINILYEIVCGV